MLNASTVPLSGMGWYVCTVLSADRRLGGIVLMLILVIWVLMNSLMLVTAGTLCRL